MRISTNMIYDSGIASMQQRQQDQLRLQQQLASGLRILTPADDPVASAAALNVRQAQGLNNQYRANGDAATTQLSLEESALADLTTLLQNVKTNAVYAGNAALSNTDRASIASELASHYQELLGIANRTDSNSQYLFSGYRGTVRPFAEISPGVVAYAGDSGQRLVQIGASRAIPVNDSGESVFRDIRNGNGTFLAAPGSGNTGSGIIDPGMIIDATKWNSAANSKDFTIRFSQNATLTAGTTNAGGASAGGGIVNQAQWNAGSKDYSIVFTAPNAYDIRDTASGAVIQSGAYVSGATISFMGAQTVITDGPGPVGPVTGDTFRFVPAVPSGYSYDVIDNVNNVSLLTGVAPGAAPYLRTYVAGAPIVLATQSPPDTNAVAFDFGASVSLDGAPSAGDTFTVKASVDQDIFATINSLIGTLRSGTSGTPASNAAYQNSLNAAMTAIDNSLNKVVTVRADVGARLKEVETAQSGSDELSVQHSKTLSGLQDLDYAKAISELSQQQIMLEAAQQSFLKITSLSLFSLL